MNKYTVRSNIQVVTLVNTEDTDKAKSIHLTKVKELVENIEKLHHSIKLDVDQYPMVTELPEETRNA